jgi:predicted short-subunit dehydrogenase-like oxidoreductase (DUF2520 family)
LNIVGCGRLGQAIAKLVSGAYLVEDIHVCNRSQASADRAVAAIGVGTAYSTIAKMPPSGLWLISCGDQEIESVANRVAVEGALMPDAVVFHCSGLLSSEALGVLKTRGASVASVHPVRSFANLEMAVQDFPGTFCGVEGELRSQEVVTEIFTKIGGRVFPLSTEGKVLCHAGHVFASNYLVALLECSRRLYGAAGIPEEMVWQLMEPLVRGTVDNVMRLGPATALTGPIARGEGAVVERQSKAVAQESPPLGDLYTRLGSIAVDVARQQGLSPESCEAVRRSLGQKL